MYVLCCVCCPAKMLSFMLKIWAAVMIQGEGVMMSYQDNPTSGYRANLHNTLRGDNVTTTQPASGDAESNQVA